jgi:hypothetical protein
MIFDKPTLNKLFKSYRIIDCAIKDANNQAYVLINKNNTLRYLFTQNNKSVMKERYSMFEIKASYPSKIAYTNSPIANFTAVSQGCRVFSKNEDFTGLENKLPEHQEGFSRAITIENVVNIKGSIYSVGCPNKMFKHIEKNNWEDITQSIPTPEDIEELTYHRYDWKDADGFAENDLYTVGGEGEVWHYDDNHWKQIPFINDDWLYNVCCAPDGLVYVGGLGCSLYVWNKTEWKVIKERFGGIDWFYDIKWFKGKLYCGEASRLRVLENDELVTVGKPFPGGSIDISPDGNYMLVAGKETAHLFDGEKWETIIDAWSV